jgi:hypothetical protein
MTKHIGRQIDVGIGKESTRGTAVAASYWIPARKLNHESKPEYDMDDAVVGTIVDTQGGEIMKDMAEGGFEADIGLDHIGLIFYSMFGSLSTATAGGESVVYDHTFTIQEGAQHQSLSINTNEPNADLRFPLSVLGSFEVNFEARSEILNYTANFKSKKQTSVSNTVSYSAETKFRPSDIAFYLDDDYSNLSSATEVKIRKINLKFEKDHTPDEVLGDTEAEDYLNNEMKISGSIELVWDAETYRNYVLNNTTKAMRLQLERSGITIGTAENPRIIFDLALCTFNEISRDTSVPNIVYQTVNFKAGYSLSDTTAGQIVLTNEVSSY